MSGRVYVSATLFRKPRRKGQVARPRLFFARMWWFARLSAARARLRRDKGPIEAARRRIGRGTDACNGEEAGDARGMVSFRMAVERCGLLTRWIVVIRELYIVAGL